MTLIEALDRGLVSPHEFCVLTDIDYYADAFARREMLIVPAKTRTRSQGRCHICGNPQTRGLYKYWLKSSKSRDLSSGWRQFCSSCLGRIHDAVLARVEPG